jgi:hypothetical protein
MTRALLVLGLTAPGFVFAQTMTEYATAAAGSTAGAAAAKKINPAVAGVLGKLDGAAKNAADQGSAKKTLVQAGETKELSKKPVTAVPVARPAPAPRLVPASRPAVPHDSPRYNPGVPEPPNARSYAWAPVAPPAVRPRPVQATPERFAQVAEGHSRAEVLKNLGNPSSRISMVEDGKFTEIYRYRDLGTVHLADGAVTTVVKN